MISPDGGLTIPATEVTWFQFLQLSRVTNSNYGGWNSKTHWVKKGLDKLCEAENLLRSWTANSVKLKVTDVPRVRKRGEFCFDRPWNRDRLLGDTAEGCSENQLNARLFKELPVNFEPYIWGELIGYEIPLADDSKGQLKVDLVGSGVFESGKKFISIVELKQGNNITDSPLMALTEAICYGIQLIRSRKLLVMEKAISGKGFEREEDIANINLILAGPRRYWDNWGSHSSEMQQKLQQIIQRVNEELPKPCVFLLAFYELTTSSSVVTPSCIAHEDSAPDPSFADLRQLPHSG